jgi:hypothetical protein
VPVHVDATDLYESADPLLEDEVSRRQAIVFLALDLVSGRVDEHHPLYDWLKRFGATDADLEHFQARGVDLPIIGINLYPMFSRKTLVKTKRGLRVQMPYASAEIVERLGRMYHERYGAPVMISETASLGAIRRRRAWLDDSVAAVRRMREAGVPLVGYTWWPMFALAAWAYRQGANPPTYYLKQMGLWDIDPDPEADLRRVHTPLVDAYRELVAGGAEAVGPLAVSGSGEADSERRGAADRPRSTVYVS